MLDRDKIAVVGDKESILAFKAVGVDVYPVDANKETSEIIKKLARSYGIIFVSEEIAEQEQEIIKRYKTRPYPAVIPIPNALGSTGFAIKNISKDVEKAIGSDILFSNHK